MTIKTELIHPNTIPYVWIEVKPLIEKALAHSDGEYSVEDILEYLLNREMSLWLGTKNNNIDYALVTEVKKLPRKKCLSIVTISSKSGYGLTPWLKSLPIIEEYALNCGCDYLEAWCRKGLARKLKWDNEYSVITKTIQKGA